MDYFIFLKAVLDYIENRVTEDLSAAEVASVAGFSAPHMREVFHRATGQSLVKYVTHRRLSHAALALSRTGRSVAEIAVTYGFGSHDAFTRAFRREFGETPSAFRACGRAVQGRVIVPGVFGPAVLKEDVSIVTAEHTTPNIEGTLYGVVPKVSYFAKEMELTPFISCLRACLTYLGQDVPYARLLAASGAAFRLMWNLEFWDGGNVDIMAMSTDPIEPLRRAFRAAGWDYRLLCKPDLKGHLTSESASGDGGRVAFGGKEDFIVLIKQEIDAGRPLIGFGVIGPPEACIIAGYRDNGETLVGWNFFQEMPEYAGSIEFEPCGYYRRRGWFEHDMTLGLMALGGRAALPEERALLRDTLSFALSVMETPRVHATYACGQAAYEAWASALLREEEFPANAPLPMLMERLMCQVDAMTMVGEGRWYAAAFLEKEAESFPAAAPALKTAAACFRREQKLVEEMAGLLEGFGMGEKQARNLAKPEVRQKMAALIRKAAGEDREAAGKIKEALGLL
ncbi:MAG: helix-turn-helix transcriptional regulator [Bacteroidota bacterium]